ncbi:MAG: hypothetical protein IPG66_03445 [Hydrogenophilales bacterium]|nr:hypothetical protein [Hydrogenophilales bacterium]
MTLRSRFLVIESSGRFVEIKLRIIYRMTLDAKFDRIARSTLLLSLMLLYATLAVTSFVHLDLARDMRTAADIVDGIRFPLLGPILAGHVHLGSGWYYLLALLQTLGQGWVGTVLLLALLSSLQFPLAYLAGKAWLNRSAGVYWALLMMIPSWSMFEQIYPGHPQLLGVCVAAMLLCALRYYRNGRHRYFLGTALAFSLALHAHPSALVMLTVVAAVLVLAWRRHHLTHVRLIQFVSVACIPFAPLIVDQLLNGFSLLQGIGGYVNSDNFSRTSYSNYLPLLWQLSGGGLRYWLAGIIGIPETLSWVVAIGVAALMALGIAGVLTLAATNDRIARFAMFMLPMGVLILIYMRGGFPYYMITALRIALLGCVAVGLANLAAAMRWRDGLSWLLGVSCIAGYLYVASAIFRIEREGAWPLAFQPIFNTTADWHEHHPRAIMPAGAMKKSGQWLCSAGAIAVHGAYAIHLIHGYSRMCVPSAARAIWCWAAPTRYASIG